jgi:hypothetical protein
MSAMKIEHPRSALRRSGLSILTLALLIVTAGCNGSYSSSGGGNTPYISGLSVSSGPAGTPVTISGTNFGATQGSSTVTFNGVAATPTSWSATTIVVPVPTGATTGNIIVTVGGKSSNGMAFTVNSTSSPSITNLSPSSGLVGTSVTITGTNFGAAQGSSTVTFYNGKAATPTGWSATSITARVPAGATTGNVVVTVGGVGSNGVTFTVTSASGPSITGLSPTSGPVGTPVTITGTNFGATQGSNTVAFNGISAGIATSWSATSIVAPVPTGATTGNVVVTVGGTASNGVAFTVTTASAPTITNLNPTSGTVGSSVTITGTNFGATQGSSTVTFNGTAATVSASNWTATSIITSVPTGATTGNVVVTVAGVASNGLNFTVPSSGSKFPIKLSANKRYFVDQTGAPWLMVGDSAHHIVNVVDPSSWPTYFASRQSQGFNTVNLIELTHGNPVANGGLPNGQLPFTGMLPSLCNGGATNPDYDLSTPNSNFWSVMDQFVSMAATYNMVVLFDPLPPSSFINDMRTSGSTSTFNFGAYLGTRYKSFPNIIWELGNDFQTWRNTTAACSGATLDNTLLQQMMAGIASTDPNHLITIQLDYYRSYSNQDTAMDAYLTAEGVYTYYETYDYALQAYKSTSTGVSPTPTLLLEANMEGANNTSLLTCSSTAADAHVLREQMYWTMTSGASGHVWGNTHVNHLDSTWQSQLSTPATAQVALLTSVFNQLQWWKLVPDTAHQVVTAGFGTPNANNENLCNSTYATAAWVPDSVTPTLASQAIVYTPVAATTTPLSVNMAMFSKTVTASWYDPTTGNSTPIGSIANSGAHSFTTPSGTHSDGTADWVLVLQ